MKTVCRKFGPAIFLFLALVWGQGVAHGQQNKQMALPSPEGQQNAPLPIPLPPQPQNAGTPENPGNAPIPLPKLPSAKGVDQQPTQQPLTGTFDEGASAQEAPAAFPKQMEKSIKDIVVGATKGPTPSNPTGRQEPGVSMEWLYPATVRLGQQVRCTLIVKSISINRLHQVIVRARVPAGATIKGSEPKAATEGDILVWNLGDMEPRQEKRIDIYLLPTAKGSLPCYAFVTFTGMSTTRLEVRESKLEIKLAAPKQVISGDTAIVALTVSNPGDARTDHVKVKVALSDGLKYGNAKGTEILVDNLGAKESRTFLLQCAARAGGEQVCTAVATGEPSLKARGTANIDVLKPRVDVAVSGPKMRYLDRYGLFTFKVTNPGTAVANHVTLRDRVPHGFKVVGATSGAYHDFASRTVVWFLGDLMPAQQKEVSLKLLAINPGEYKNEVSVTAARGLRSTSEILTRIEGLPGLQMEMVDVADPVELGKDMSYEIRLTNTGTKTETNLQLVCTLADKMDYRGAKCSVGIAPTLEGRKITFPAIPRLAPRADVIFRINVRATAPGDLRFHAQVTADGLESPVLREESTRVFGDERETAPASPAAPAAPMIPDAPMPPPSAGSTAPTVPTVPAPPAPPVPPGME